MSSLFQTELAASSKAISKHWKSCEEAGLPHSSENLAPILEAMTLYVTTLENLPKGHGDAPVLEAMHRFYDAAKALNAQYDEGLLETDERELIVPVLVRLAELAGIDSAKYDGEPGSEFRDF